MRSQLTRAVLSLYDWVGAQDQQPSDVVVRCGD